MQNEFISGKDALIALADGKKVQGSIGLKWIDIDVMNKKTSLASFFTEQNKQGFPVKFRLASRTITINGIKVPAPFQPKIGDIYYFINNSNLSGFAFSKFNDDSDDKCLMIYGAWRTEEEIKQVVEALRSIFNAEK